MRHSHLLFIIAGLLLFPAKVKAPPHVDFMTRSLMADIGERLKRLERSIGNLDRRNRRQHEAVMDALADIQRSLQP